MRKNEIVKASTNQGDRLYVIVSPDEMNVALDTLIICPLITTKRSIPTQVTIKPNIKSGLIDECFMAIDQIATMNKVDIKMTIGEISECEMEQASIILQEMFAL